MTINPAARPALQKLYDQRQQELKADEVKLDQFESRAASAHQWAKGGMATLFTGMGATVASTLVSPALKSGVLGAGIGLTAAGLAIFCPAIWIRDNASMEAMFTRAEAGALRESQRELAEELR